MLSVKLHNNNVMLYTLVIKIRTRFKFNSLSKHIGYNNIFLILMAYIHTINNNLVCKNQKCLVNKNIIVLGSIAN